MKTKNKFLILLLFIVNILYCQNEAFFSDVNGDNKYDLITIIKEGEELIIKQNFSGEGDYIFTYLSEIRFDPLTSFDFYTIADIDGDNRANLILVKNNTNGKDLWYYEILPGKVLYIGHTFVSIPNSINTTQMFADINNDNQDELILIQNITSNKEIWTYIYNDGDFVYQQDSHHNLIDSSLRKEYFADITGDGNDDMILIQDYNNDQRVWVYKSDGIKFEYLAFTNLVDHKGKKIYFLNSNAAKDNYLDLILADDTSSGKRLWLYESDGARFIYEISNDFEEHSNKELLFGDVNNDSTDDLIVIQDDNAWAYKSHGNVFEYREHSYLNLNSLPPNRLFDWENAGYNNGSSIPVNFNISIDMPEPNENPTINNMNLTNMLDSVVNIKNNPNYNNQHVVINFKSGIYNFNETIRLREDNNHSFVIFRGQGIGLNSTEKTEIVFNIEGNPVGIDFIEITGDNANFIQEIGIENLSIRYDENDSLACEDNLRSYLLDISNAKNCWLKNIEISNIYSTAINIARSKNIDVRDSYFHDAICYGGDGRGYGIVLTDNTEYCKVENNIFKGFRHAMQVSFYAHHNVFGYNYSRDQIDQLDNVSLGDLNLHGYGPHHNLFEGNIVDKIHADDTFFQDITPSDPSIKNGEFNVFFRNDTFRNDITIENTPKSSIIGYLDDQVLNIFDDNETTLDRVDFNYKLFDKEGFVITEYEFLNDTSLYLKEIPSFFQQHIVNEKVTWPAIGAKSGYSIPLIPGKSEPLVLVESEHSNLVKNEPLVKRFSL